MKRNVFILLLVFIPVNSSDEASTEFEEKRDNEQVAKPHAFPSVVYLFSKQGPCNGIIIDRENVVTRASDVSNETRYTIYAGFHNMDEYNKSTMQITRSKKVIIHPKFNASVELDEDNNIAIIRLAKPLKFNKYVRPIELPSQDQDFPANSDATVVGFVERNDVSLMLFGMLKLLSSVECTKLADEEPFGTYMDNKLCAAPPESEESTVSS